MSMKGVKQVLIPILDCYIYLVRDKASAREFLEAHAHDADPTVFDRAEGVCYVAVDEDGNHHRMMCVFAESTNAIVHESVHAAWMTLEHCGLKATARNHEMLAYTAAWLADEMLDFKRPKRRRARP